MCSHIHTISRPPRHATTIFYGPLLRTSVFYQSVSVFGVRPCMHAFTLPAFASFIPKEWELLRNTRRFFILLRILPRISTALFFVVESILIFAPFSRCSCFVLSFYLDDPIGFVLRCLCFYMLGCDTRNRWGLLRHVAMRLVLQYCFSIRFFVVCGFNTVIVR